MSIKVKKGPREDKKRSGTIAGLIGDDYICIKNNIRTNKEQYKTNVRTLLTEIKNSMRTDYGVVVFALVKECF